MTSTASADFDFDSFWDAVHKYVEGEGLTPTDLADRINMDMSSVRDAYKYRKSIHLSTLLRIAYLCDLSVETYSTAARNVIL